MFGKVSKIRFIQSFKVQKNTTGLEQHQDYLLHFCVNYPFKCLQMQSIRSVVWEYMEKCPLLKPHHPRRSIKAQSLQTAATQTPPTLSPNLSGIPCISSFSHKKTEACKASMFVFQRGRKAINKLLLASREKERMRPCCAYTHICFHFQGNHPPLDRLKGRRKNRRKLRGLVEERPREVVRLDLTRQNLARTNMRWKHDFTQQLACRCVVILDVY